MDNKKIDYIKGLSAEAFASSILKLKGFTILAKRLKTPYGEIDIIAQKKDLIVACEIKYRKTYETAIHSITAKQQQRIINAFQYWLSEQNQSIQNCNLRLDAILIYKYGFEHIQNAWQA